MKTIIKYILHYWKMFAVVLVLLIVKIFSDLLSPTLMSNIVNEIVRYATDNSIDIYGRMFQVGGYMILVTVISVLCLIAVTFLAARASELVGRDLRLDLFKKVASLESEDFESFSTASLITRTTNDVEQVQGMIIMGLGLVIMAPLMGIGSVIMAMRKSVSLAWTIGVAVIVIVGILICVMIFAMPRFKKIQLLVDKLNLVSREQLSGLMVVRAYRNEKYEEKKFDTASYELTKTTRFVERIMGVAQPMVVLVINLLTVAIVWYGADAIASFELQLGDMMAYLQYAMQIMMSFIMLSMLFVVFPRASISAKRIEEVLKKEESIKDSDNAKDFLVKEGTIEFKDVSFKYANADENIISNVSFVAKPHETTAIIGSTGSGKSTLVNLIPRFYETTSGSIELNGVNIKEIKKTSLRDNIGYIPQKNILFAGTVESNIKYGDAENNTTPEELDNILEVSQSKEFVNDLDNGVESLISQNAANISGGQKQRLSIARALAKNPPIYIFDDSFSALDFKTDLQIRKALKSYTENATVIIVAQRVSTILDADQIIVMDEGRIVGRGKHDELLENCSQYREICESQLSKEVLK